MKILNNRLNELAGANRKKIMKFTTNKNLRLNSNDLSFCEKSKNKIENKWICAYLRSRTPKILYSLKHTI